MYDYIKSKLEAAKKSGKNSLSMYSVDYSYYAHKIPVSVLEQLEADGYSIRFCGSKKHPRSIVVFSW